LKSTNKFANNNIKFHGGQPALPDYLEAELEQYCLDMESRFFDVRIDDLRRLAYELAEANGVEHNFDKDKKIAGWKWYYGFMRRHSNLALRSPENTSIASSQGFNRPRMEAFFQLLSTVYDRECLTPDRLTIWTRPVCRRFRMDKKRSLHKKERSRWVF